MSDHLLFLWCMDPPVILSSGYTLESPAELNKPLHPRTIKLVFSSVTQLCLTLCDPMDYRTSGCPVHHQLPELTQTHVPRVSDAIHLILCHPISSCLQSFPVSGSFPMSQLFVSGGQSIGVSASISVLPMNLQD